MLTWQKLNIVLIIILLVTKVYSATILVDDFNNGIDPMVINAGSSIESVSSGGALASISYQIHSSTNPSLGNSGYCFKISHTNTDPTWVRFNFNTQINLTNYRALSFWVRGEAGGETFKMDLRGFLSEEPGFRPDIRNFLTNGVTTSWQKVVIPAWTLHKDLEKGDIDGFIIDIEGYPVETFYIDDLTFHDKLAPSYVDNFNDGSVPNTWGIDQWKYILTNGNPSATNADFIYSTNSVNRVGSYGYGYQIDWNSQGTSPVNDSMTASEMLPRNWGAGISGEDLSACDQVSFYALAGTNGLNRKIGVGLFTDAGSELDHIHANSLTLSDTWQKVTRNISEFPGIAQANICGVQWWVIKSGICTNTNDFTFYIDNVVFEDTTLPQAPSALLADGNPVSDGYKFKTGINNLTASAQAGFSDISLEGIYFEYSTNGTIWYRIGTDYDTADVTYFSVWDTAGLNENKTYSIKVTAMDTSGQTAELIYNNCTIQPPLSSFNGPDKEDLKVLNSLVDFTKGEDKAIFRFSVKSEGIIKINIYTIKGELVRNIVKANYAPGIYDKEWDIKNKKGELIGSGIYLVNIETGFDNTITKKIMVIR